MDFNLSIATWASAGQNFTFLESTSVIGQVRSEKLCMNRRYHPQTPRNPRTCFRVFGDGQFIIHEILAGSVQIPPLPMTYPK